MPRFERARSAASFNDQLLQRLKNRAQQDGVAPQRLQQRVAFERLLARLPADGRLVLKGGFALQLRFGAHTRLTRDLDFRTTGTPGEALSTLRNAISAETVDDGFTFELAAESEEMQGAPGGTLRTTVVTLVGGSQFAMFRIDLSAGDALVGAPEFVVGSNLLDFAGIKPVQFPIYPIAQHLAEKLHAYTLPRTRENTRVKDLLDLALFATTERVAADQLRESVEATFQVRASHDLPMALPAPPASWGRPYAALAAETAIPQLAELEAGYALASLFWNPFLAARVPGLQWFPVQRRWGSTAL